MKSVLSLALLVGLGLSATAVQAWGTPDGTPDTCGASTFPATGQTTSFPPISKTTDAPVRDDGVVRAGGALRYQNNGDGTITDLNTGLMWEQKIRDIATAQGNHDVTRVFPWDQLTGTIWDWLEQVNTEGGTGLAGHNDWRIPNVKELMSIVDYERSMPPVVDAAFNNGVAGPCDALSCSRTQSDFYWSSTTHAAVPGNAWFVIFGAFGTADDGGKNIPNFVRAVRGGCVPGGII